MLVAQNLLTLLMLLRILLTLLSLLSLLMLLNLFLFHYSCQHSIYLLYSCYLERNLLYLCYLVYLRYSSSYINIVMSYLLNLLMLLNLLCYS